MKYYKSINIIGVDHGYGNIKTAGTCFQAGVMAYDKEPLLRAICLYGMADTISSEQGIRSFLQTK